jgi:two-component system, NtrC family, sensor histidine kinase HydH
MNQRLLIRVTAPAVVIGLLLLATCMVSIHSIKRLQSNLDDILDENVRSLRAALELEIRVRQLRFHSLLYLLDPEKAQARVKRIEQDQDRFEAALNRVRQGSTTDKEKEQVRAIEAGYEEYQAEQARLRKAAAQGRPAREFSDLADKHPVDKVVNPCEVLRDLNEEKMKETAAEGQRVGLERWMLLVGIAGPLGGLLMGYGVARTLRRSIYRLSVRVQDVAQRLDEKVASVSVAADGDIHALDQQMQHIIEKVEEVAGRLQEQQRELTRAEQLSTMGQLAAGVAHEVRNPLTSIKMLVEAGLRARRPRPLSEEDLRVIHREIDRLEHTVQGFLDFARLPPSPSAGGPGAGGERAPCDLRNVIEQACQLVRARAREQDIELVVRAPAEPVLVTVDRAQFGTVLVNLFLNALDAMPAGGRLEATLAAPADDGAIRLTVADTGAGIPPEMLGKLFRPFVTSKPHGTGLGLSISARVLEEHGGSITAANRPEGGACFTVTLPAAAPVAACEEQPA